MLSLFQDPSDLTEIDQIEDRADPPAASVAAPLGMAILSGVVGLYFGGAVVGGALFALPAYVGLGKLKDGWNTKLFLRRNPGCYAHILKSDRDMIAYLEELGREEVTAQLIQAKKAKQRFSPSGKRAYKMLVPEEAKPAKNLREYLDNPEKEQGGIAKDGTVKAIAEKRAQTSAKNLEVTLDVVEHFLQHPRCTFLCAPPRTGKGIILAAMLAGIKGRYKQSWIGTCTIKQFSGENWYWQDSDSHINPDAGDDRLQTCREIYELYQEWISQDSSAENPAFIFIDELRDTLLRLKGITMGQVDPSFKVAGKDFCDWLREELISSATLNQCHHRFAVLAAPVNTAKALTFPDANSLQSYAAYILVTPTELSFAKAGNSAFAAPKIEANDSKFVDWYGLAWSTKSSQWLGVPSIPQQQIEKMAEENPALNWKYSDAEEVDSTGFEAMAHIAVTQLRLGKISEDGDF